MEVREFSAPPINACIEHLVAKIHPFFKLIGECQFGKAVALLKENKVINAMSLWKVYID